MPRNEVDNVRAHLDPSARVKDGRRIVADEIGRHDLVLRVLDDALLGTFSGSRDGGFDLFVARGFLDAHNKVDDGYVQCGHTECEVAILGSKGKNKQTKDVSFPLSEGMTLPTALAAPVEEGVMLLLTLHPPRQSLCNGSSRVFRVAVVAWTVVIRPSMIPKLSCIILAIGAK